MDEHFSNSRSHCAWDDGNNQHFDSPQCWLQTALERPFSPYPIICYAALLTMLLIPLLVFRKRPKQLKASIFWLLCLIILLGQCLSSFYVTPEWSAPVWDSTAPYRGFWILLVEAPFWRYTYFGFYADFSIYVFSLATKAEKYIDQIIQIA
jgi:hypothetical protein